MASAHVRPARRPGPRPPRAHQRARLRPHPPRLPVHGNARRGQDHDRAHLRQVAQLREGRVVDSVRQVPGLHRHRRRPLRRPARSRRRLAHQGGRHARPARQRAVPARARSLQGLPDRRSPHALDALVQRVAENARGAAAARQVPARDHRSAEAAGHGAVALPAVPPAAPAAAADLRPAGADQRGRAGRVRAGRAEGHRARRRRQHARCAVAARPGAGVRRRSRARGRSAHAARHARPQARPGHPDARWQRKTVRR